MALLAQFAQKIIPIFPRQHYIQDDRIIDAASRIVQPAFAVQREIGEISVLCQQIGQSLRQTLFIFDY